ncbi:MAG: N,N-dimethylformamidase beta subunit family domain-containing protein [Acidobacteriota bacterium]
MLKGTLAAPLGAVAAQTPAGRRDSTLIQRGNSRPGSTDWQLTKIRIPRNGYRSPDIEGYCSRQSVEAGDKLQIMVSANPPGSFRMEIFRMGYYAGRGARLVGNFGPFKAKTQPDPPVGERRLRECKWDPTTEITIPADWISGVYLGRLSLVAPDNKTHDWQSFIVFIVRDRRPADILFQCADNTWQAYNRWPDDYSLYTDPRGASVPGVDVSFDRPYGKYPQVTEYAASQGSGSFLLWEFPLCYWLEQHGYDVTYCSNSDMIVPSQILRSKVFISVGHDEYWDERQYHNAMAGVKAGVTELYLAGNTVHWVTPFRPGSSGQPNRIIARRGPFGPFPPERLTKDPVPFDYVGPDEGLLMGARTPSPANGCGDWIVTRPDHWVFEGTGMKKGDYVPGLVGWEHHGLPADLPGLEILAEGIALRGGTEPVRWTATIYQGPKDNFVFNAATIWWSQGLSSPPGHVLPWSHFVHPHGPDARVQRITRNLLRRALGKRS